MLCCSMYAAVSASPMSGAEERAKTCGFGAYLVTPYAANLRGPEVEVDAKVLTCPFSCFFIA
jgi:hypothetical protein